MVSQPFLPDDHSEVVPPLPIPNRTVKRLSADDSADSCVKVGHRQAPHTENPLLIRYKSTGRFLFFTYSLLIQLISLKFILTDLF